MKIEFRPKKNVKTDKKDMIAAEEIKELISAALNKEVSYFHVTLENDWLYPISRDEFLTSNRDIIFQLEKEFMEEKWIDALKFHFSCEVAISPIFDITCVPVENVYPKGWRIRLSEIKRHLRKA